MTHAHDQHNQALQNQGGPAGGGQLEEIDVDLSISLKFTWANTLPVLLSLTRDGKGEAVGFARLEFQRMAATADLCNEALALLAKLAETGEYDSAELVRLVAQASRLASSGTLPVGAMADSKASTETVRTQYGVLAAQCGQRLPLEVLYSAAGWYIGTCLDDMPYSRESVQYWPKRELAAQALTSGKWSQKQNP